MTKTPSDESRAQHHGDGGHDVPAEERLAGDGLSEHVEEATGDEGDEDPCEDACVVGVLARERCVLDALALALQRVHLFDQGHEVELLEQIEVVVVEEALQMLGLQAQELRGAVSIPRDLSHLFVGDELTHFGVEVLPQVLLDRLDPVVSIAPLVAPLVVARLASQLDPKRVDPAQVATH